MHLCCSQVANVDWVRWKCERKCFNDGLQCMENVVMELFCKHNTTCTANAAQGTNGVEITAMWNSMLIYAQCAPCTVLACRICSAATCRNYMTMGCVHFPERTSCIRS